MSEVGRVQVAPAPPGGGRVETGAVRFGDDWPGLFVRGDNAMSLALWVRRLAGLVAGDPRPDVADAVRQLLPYADLIDWDVLGRRAVGAAADAEPGAAADPPKAAGG